MYLTFRRLVPAFLALLLVSASLGAQVRVAREATVHAVPDGNTVATLAAGTSWGAGTVRGAWTQVTLEGWVASTRLAGRRDSFPESIGGTATLRIRAEPSLSGRILGEFQPQAGLHVLDRQGTWARIRRVAWVRTSQLAQGEAVATAGAAGAAGPGASSTTAASAAAPRPASGSLRTDNVVQLRLAPTGAAVGQLEPGAVVEPLARDRGWVRVQIEAWVPESLLVPVDSSYEPTLTAADLRMDPDGLKGKLIRWSVQVVGLQTGDGLRRDIAVDEPYLLAMGPDTENTMMYLTVPPNLLADVRNLPPLAKVLITARVRTGRSEPAGAPILELMSVTR